MRIIFKCMYITPLKSEKVNQMIRQFEGIGLSPQNIAEVFGIQNKDFQDLVKFSKAVCDAMGVPTPTKKL